MYVRMYMYIIRHTRASSGIAVSELKAREWKLIQMIVALRNLPCAMLRSYVLWEDTPRVPPDINSSMLAIWEELWH